MNQDLLNRRAFFKKSAKSALPILLGATLFPSFASCGIGDDDDYGCTGSSCSSACSSSCATGCSTTCKDSSSSSICSNCANNCSNTSTNSSSNNNTSDISSYDGSVGGYKYIDLGLSVKWATYNIGASSPEKSGTKLEFSEGVNSISGQSKVALYFINVGFNTKDSISGTSYDQTYNKWGKQWKTPTKADYEELINNCGHEIIEYNGVKVYKFTSKKNKHSVYFNGTDLWTGTFSLLATYTGAEAHTFSPIAAYIHTGGGVGSEKFCIRPVTTGSNSSSTGCNNGCTANCASNSTNSSCASCASSCNSGCKQQCDYNCAATCKSHCYSSCNDTCGGSCKYVSAGTKCSGCATTCNGRCYKACTYACSSSCQSSCVGGSK